MDAETDQLTINTLEASYYLPAGARDQVALRARLDRLAHERLPDALAERLSSLSTEHGAVYRIRHLRVDLWLDAARSSDGQIARAWGGAVAEVLARALALAPSSEVMRYDDAAHYIASFLGDLMAGRAWSRWVYEEFAPLRDLPVGQVAAFLLAPRPALLVPVARRLRDGRQLERLLHELQPGDVRLLWERGLGFDDGGSAIPPADAVHRTLDALRGGVPLEQGGDASHARNALRLYLAAALAQPTLVGRAAVGRVCAHLARAYALWVARPSRPLWEALARGQIPGREAVAPFIEALASRLPLESRWLGDMLDKPEGRAYLARLAQAVVPAEGDTVEGHGQPVGRVEQIATNFAGLGLLLPALRDLGLYDHVGSDGLYQLLLAAVGQAYQPLAWGDAAVARLAGVDPAVAEEARRRAVDWPVATSEAGPGGEAEEDVAPLWARLALRRFATGLRGFEESTPGYLARQFLILPGTVVFGERQVEVTLSRAPLGIVLQMAGYDGDRGAVPWLGGRRLWIELPSG